MKTIFTSLLVLVSSSIFAYSPVVSYTGPQIYTLGKSITALKPNNTGGAVSVYGTVSTIGLCGGQAQCLTLNADRTLLYAPLSQAFKVNQIALPYTLSLFAGSGTKGSASGVAELAQFSMAWGVAIHPFTEDIYVADADSSVIKKINPTTGEVTHYAGIKGKGATLDGNVSIARFSSPHGLAFDENGNLYVAQTGGNMIRKITADGMEVTTLTVLGVEATALNPWNIAYANGFLYVTEVTGHKVDKVDVITGQFTVLAGSGTSGFADGTGSGAQFNGPRGITVDDATGIVYVADYTNDRIRKITPEGVVTTISGYGVSEAKDGIGILAGHRKPAGIVYDGLGNLYVCDAASQQIRKIAVDVNPISNPYSISPALPDGLVLNTKTGVISGTPTSESPSTDYIITASNASGSSDCVLNISVESSSGLKDAITNPLNVSVVDNAVIQIKGEVSGNSMAIIYDVQGKMILTKSLIPGNLNTISIPNVKSGLYLLSIKNNDSLQRIKIIVK